MAIAHSLLDFDRIMSDAAVEHPASSGNYLFFFKLSGMKASQTIQKQNVSCKVHLWQELSGEVKKRPKKVLQLSMLIFIFHCKRNTVQMLNQTTLQQPTHY